jgi:hypothetical protein
VNVLLTSYKRDKESDHGEECNSGKLGRRSRITEQNNGERERERGEYKRDHIEIYSESVEELEMERERRGRGNPKMTQSTLLYILLLKQ